MARGARVAKPESSVQVLVRVRPPVSSELDAQAESGRSAPVDVDDRVITIRAPKRSYRAEFDRVFDEHSTQAEVFASVSDCISSTLDGFNSTLFAFGQTGSGKTHTLFGPPTTQDHFFGVTPEAGVGPRVIASIFGEISQRQRARRDLHEGGGAVDSSNATTSVYLSFLQVYNERVYDLLLAESDSNAPVLRVHEDAERGIFVEGISQFAVSSKDECMLLLRTGVANRVVRETRMNEHSSRSHSVFQLLIEQKFGGPEGRIVKSKLNIVDLAGSERWDAHAIASTSHIAEMTNINLSLHTLGRCIAALAENSRLQVAENAARRKLRIAGSAATAKGKKKQELVPKAKRAHVPYRESVLTRLLQDSLGGNTKTRIIVTISPGMRDHKESISTLKFADSAKRIMSIVSINTERVITRALVERLEREVRHLRGAVDTLVPHVPPHIASQALEVMSEEIGRNAGRGGAAGGVGAAGGEAMMVLEQKTFAALAENKRLREALAAARAEAGAAGEHFAGSPSSKRRSAATSGGAGGAGAITIVAAEPRSGMYYRAEDIYRELTRLRGSVGQIKSLARRFFDLEIEEGEMETSLASLLSAASKSLPMRRAAPKAAASKAAKAAQRSLAAASDVTDAQLAAAEAIFDDAAAMGEGGGGRPNPKQPSKAAFARKLRREVDAASSSPSKSRRRRGGEQPPSPTPSTNSSSTLGTVTLSPTVNGENGEAPLSSPLLVGRVKWGATRHTHGLPNPAERSITEVKKTMRRRQKTSKALNGMQVRRVARGRKGGRTPAKSSLRDKGAGGAAGEWKRVEDTSETELRAELKRARVARKQQEKMRLYLKQKVEREQQKEKQELEQEKAAADRKAKKQRGFEARARKQKAIVEEYRRRRDQALNEELTMMDNEAVAENERRKRYNAERIAVRNKKMQEIEAAKMKKKDPLSTHHSPTVSYGSPPPREDGMGGYLERAQLEAEKFSAAATRLDSERYARGQAAQDAADNADDQYENLDFYAEHIDFLRT